MNPRRQPVTPLTRRKQRPIRRSDRRLIIDEHICGPDGFMRPIRVRRISHFQRFLLDMKAMRRSFVNDRPARLALRTGLVLLLLLVTASLWWGFTGEPRQNRLIALFQASRSAERAADSSAPSSESMQIDELTDAQPLAAPPNAHLEVQTVMTSAIPSQAALPGQSTQTAQTMDKPASKVTPTPPVATAATAGAKAALSSTQTTTAATRSVYDNVALSATRFPGIAASVTEQWQFPLKIEPTTPGIGLFGATRSNMRCHAGIDLYAAPGTLVYAMADGRVRNIEVFYQSLLAIEVENLDGTTIRYGELDSLVKIGDAVRQGQPIGKLRRNYDKTCMLHLEIYATIAPEPLTDLENKSEYLYVPVSARSYRRRGDLVDPSAVYSLRRP